MAQKPVVAREVSVERGSIGERGNPNPNPRAVCVETNGYVAACHSLLSGVSEVVLLIK